MQQHCEIPPVDCTVSIGVTRIDNAVQIIVSDTGEGVSDRKIDNTSWNPSGAQIKAAVKTEIPRWVGVWDCPLYKG